MRVCQRSRTAKFMGQRSGPNIDAGGDWRSYTWTRAACDHHLWRSTCYRVPGEYCWHPVSGSWGVYWPTTPSIDPKERWHLVLDSIDHWRLTYNRRKVCFKQQKIFGYCNQNKFGCAILALITKCLVGLYVYQMFWWLSPIFWLLKPNIFKSEPLMFMNTWHTP